MKTTSNKVRHIITLTTGQYDHLYNIMCSQEEIIDYLNESDDFDPQTFDNLFDAICAAKETYLSLKHLSFKRDLQVTLIFILKQTPKMKQSLFIIEDIIKIVSILWTISFITMSLIQSQKWRQFNENNYIN